MHLCDMTDEQIKEVFAELCEDLGYAVENRDAPVARSYIDATWECAAAIRAFEPNGEKGQGG